MDTVSGKYRCSQVELSTIFATQFRYPAKVIYTNEGVRSFGDLAGGNVGGSGSWSNEEDNILSNSISSESK
jgi:hypothetical protein